MLYISEVVNKDLGKMYKIGDIVHISSCNDKYAFNVCDSGTGVVKSYDFGSFYEEFYTDYNTDFYGMTEFVFGAQFVFEDIMVVSPQSVSDLSWAEDTIKRLKSELVMCKLLSKNFKFYASPLSKGIVVLQYLDVEDGCSIEIPKFVNCLGSFCFSDDIIENLAIPAHVKYIFDECFSSLCYLETLKFEGDLKYMGGRIFSNIEYKSLREVVMPRHINEMSEDALYTNEFQLSNTKFFVPRSLYVENRRVFDDYKDNIGSIEFID